MAVHHNINYLEFPSANLRLSKAFFQSVFNWRFTDYGDEYTAFSNDTIEGGIYLSKLQSNTDYGAALIVFFSANLEQSRTLISEAGGTIKQDIFSFPGGRRFHFTEPGGSEFAIWSES